jgi:hypothetical protein
MGATCGTRMSAARGARPRGRSSAGPFRGRVGHRNSQYGLYAAACMRGCPDLGQDVAAVVQQGADDRIGVVVPYRRDCPVRVSAWEGMALGVVPGH